MKKRPLSNTVSVLKRWISIKLRHAVTPARSYGKKYGTRRYKTSRRPGLLGRFNTRTVFIAAGSVAAIAAIVLIIVLTAGKPKEAAVDAGPMPKVATVAVPAYSPLSISKGLSANVVRDMQLKLMELGYLDEDEPGGLYDELTAEGINHFQIQHGLEENETVDSKTIELLFSGSAQEYVISLGTENTDVAELQQRLCELDYLETATGNFGPETETAVKKFQKMNSLDEDGKVGKVVRELLYSEEAVSNAFSYGEESAEILEFQKKLKSLGYLASEPDGKFGPDTRAAVKCFQENAGLIADGYIGSQTKEALMSDDAQGNALSIGAKGEIVTKVQERLKQLKYIKKVTGYFGSDTDAAVRSFQNNNGLARDGKVGVNTMTKLFSSSAKKSTGVNITGANANSLIQIAMSKRGCKYVRGAKGPNSFDCSGFVYWCLNKVGVKQGYMTSGTWAKSTKYTKIKSMGSLRKGDIIVYKGHVAICAGGGYMIDASSHNRKVVKRKYTGSSYWKKNFICGFRIF